MRGLPLVWRATPSTSDARWIDGGHVMRSAPVPWARGSRRRGLLADRRGRSALVDRHIARARYGGSSRTTSGSSGGLLLHAWSDAPATSRVIVTVTSWDTYAECSTRKVTTPRKHVGPPSAYDPADGKNTPVPGGCAGETYGIVASLIGESLPIESTRTTWHAHVLGEVPQPEEANNTISAIAIRVFIAIPPSFSLYRKRTDFALRNAA